MSLKIVTGNLKDFERIHILNIIEVQKHSTGKEQMLPNNVLVLNDYGNIIISKNTKKAVSDYKKQYILQVGCNNISPIKSTVYIELVEAKEYIHCKKNKFVQYFDYDKIEGDVTLRNRREGDKFIPLGMTGSKKLKDLFIDLKVSKDKRNDIPIICFGDKIGWIVGYRISELFKVDKNTRNILAIKFESEELGKHDQH